MATLAKTRLPWKPLPAPTGDFYQPADTLNAEGRAHAARVTILGVLTASIAHEINQSLSGIVTNANTCVRIANRGEFVMVKRSIVSVIDGHESVRESLADVLALRG